MPKRRRTRRRSRRSNFGQVTYSAVQKYAAGAGQINFTPKEMGFTDASMRAVTPIRARISISLTGEANIIASEPLYIKLYNFAIDADVVKIIGPFLVGVLPKTFHVRWPRTVPTQIGNIASRKLFSIYDMGTNSKLGMLVACTLVVREGPKIADATALDLLPVKMALLTLHPHQLSLPGTHTATSSIASFAALSDEEQPDE